MDKPPAFLKIYSIRRFLAIGLIFPRARPDSGRIVARGSFPSQSCDSTRPMPYRITRVLLGRRLVRSVPRRAYPIAHKAAPSCPDALVINNEQLMNPDKLSIVNNDGYAFAIRTPKQSTNVQMMTGAITSPLYFPIRKSDDGDAILGTEFRRPHFLTF